jgi:hypothetical protein
VTPGGVGYKFEFCWGAPGGIRTHMAGEDRRLAKPLRMPIPPRALGSVGRGCATAHAVARPRSGAPLSVLPAAVLSRVGGVQREGGAVPYGIAPWAARRGPRYALLIMATPPGEPVLRFRPPPGPKGRLRALRVVGLRPCGSRRAASFVPQLADCCTDDLLRSHNAEVVQSVLVAPPGAALVDVLHVRAKGLVDASDRKPGLFHPGEQSGHRHHV